MKTPRCGRGTSPIDGCAARGPIAPRSRSPNDATDATTIQTLRGPTWNHWWLGNVPRIANRPAENITVDIADIRDSTVLLRKKAAGKSDMTAFIVRVTGVAPS